MSHARGAGRHIARGAACRLRARAFLLVALLAACLVVAACGGPALTSLDAAGAPPTIRVRLGNPRPASAFAIRGQTWTLRAIAGSSFLLRGGGDIQARLGVATDGITVRGRSTQARVLAIEPDDHLTLDGRVYDGRVLVHLDGGKLVIVNELDMETYVAGVIGNEVGPNALAATYRAQAVAARTYAWMRVREQGASARFHVYDSSASQVYKGRSVPAAYKIRYADMVHATHATRGVIVTYDGRPFRTYYASTCGGHTTNPATSGLAPGHAKEPLRGVACAHCSTSKYFTWTKQVTDAELMAGLKKRKRAVLAPVRDIRITKRGRGTWVAEAAIVHGPKGAIHVLPGHELRSALGLRSNRVETITRVRGGWVVTGRGWGHGVGMCQWGAIEMGRKGASAKEILRYYYPGIAFTKVY